MQGITSMLYELFYLPALAIFFTCHVKMWKPWEAPTKEKFIVTKWKEETSLKYFNFFINDQMVEDFWSYEIGSPQVYIVVVLKKE